MKITLNAKLNDYSILEQNSKFKIDITTAATGDFTPSSNNHFICKSEHADVITQSSVFAQTN